MVAVGILIAGYNAARFPHGRGATLEIETVGDRSALVRLDGVVRGNPPMRISNLMPGLHEIEVDAKGYLSARRKLYVGAGRVTPVSLVLGDEMPRRVPATIAPVVETSPLTPTMEHFPHAAPTDEPTVPSTDTMGELLISTLPWSHVLIDDQDTGRDTPVRALKVKPGPHHLGLITPDGEVHNLDIDVERGQILRIIRRF